MKPPETSVLPVRARPVGVALRGERRGSVSLLVTVALPALLMAAGISVEVAQWALAKQQLQRAADAASIAGAAAYGAGRTASQAAATAADVAELNGVAGAASRTWSSSTQTMTDGGLTVTLGAGIGNTSATAVTVTATRTVPASFSAMMGGESRTLTATASANSLPGSMTGSACIIALDTSSGISKVTITDANSAALNLQGCALRSNASISVTGAGNVAAASVYASGNIALTGSSKITATTVAGTVSTSGTAKVVGTVIAPAAAIADPYAGNAALNAAFAQLNSSGAAPLSVTGIMSVTLSPGVWSSWNIGNSGVVTLQPGLYVVTGAISIGGASKVSGTGVTIVHGGTFSVGNSAAMTLTAPNTNPAGGAVPAVLLASPTAGTVTFSGASTFPLTGVIYYPAAAVNWANSSAPGNGSGCLELIAKSVTITGAVSMAANCGSYGAAPTFTGTASQSKLER